MAVHKRCAASGRAQRAESAANEIQHVKIYLQQTLKNQSKYMHGRRFAVTSSQWESIDLSEFQKNDQVDKNRIFEVISSKGKMTKY